MSDVGLNFTWYEIVFFFLALWFWPITGAALLAGIWVWRKRSSRWARIAAAVAGVLWLTSLGTTVYVALGQAASNASEEADLKARQRTLDHAETIRGIRLPAGTVVTFESGQPPPDIEDLRLPSTTTIRGVPMVGEVRFSTGEVNGDVTLARTLTIDGIACSSKAPARFALGHLAECALDKPSRVKGAPCGGTVDVEQGVVCDLAADYRRFGVVWRPGTKLTDYGSDVWFHTGALPPSLRAFGSALGPGTEVAYQEGALSSLDLQSRPLPYRACTFDLVMIQAGAVTGRAVGTCALPATGAAGYIPLPASALAPAPVLPPGSGRH